MRYLAGVLFIVLQLLNWANAASDFDLYSINVPVRSESAVARHRAIRAALEDVLVKASGDSALRDDAKLAQALKNPSAILEEYSYQQSKTADDEEILLLHVRFQPQAILQLLQQLGYGLWERQRPQLLVWLVVQDPLQHKQVISADGDNPLAEQLQQEMRDHGLSIFLPVFDLNTMSVISTDDVWQVNRSALQQASLRYAVKTQAIIRLSEEQTSGWQADATLLSDDKRLDFVATNSQLSRALVSIVDQLGHALVQAQQVDEQRQEQLALTITHINDVADYAKLVSYLRQFAAIKDAQITRINGQEVDVALSVLGGDTQLRQLLSQAEPVRLDKVSLKMDDADMHHLTYQWIDETGKHT